MILQNFKNLLFAQRRQPYWLSNGSYKYVPLSGLTVKDLSGNDLTGYCFYQNIEPTSSGYNTSSEEYNPISPISANETTTYRKWTHQVGTGTTDAAPDDYQLESDATSSFSSVQTARAINMDADGNMVTTFTLTGQNSGSEAVTITEVGVFLGAFFTASTSSYPGINQYIMVIRQLLNSPITVEPGKGYRIVIEMIENVTA